MSVLEGSLEHFALPDVFRLVAQNKVTGALKVARASGEGTVFFREGEVYFAFSNLTKEFLGQRLVNAKLITEGQLLRMLDEQKKAGEKRIGDLLVEKGFLSKDLLDTFLKEQIQDAIFSMLQWDVGMFEFLADEVAPQEVGLSVSVENLIMESSRRIEEWEVIRRKIPTMEVIVRMAPSPPEDAVEINIRPEEWTLLVLADGKRTVREIAAGSERSEFEACKIIYGLITAGLLDVASGATAVGAPEEHVRPVRRAKVSAPPEERIEPPPEAIEPELLPPEQTLPPAEPREVEVPLSQPEPVQPSSEPTFPTPPEPAEVTAEEELRTITIAEERVDEELVATAEARNGATTVDPDGRDPAGATEGARRKGDPTVSKELLLRLIAGVRDL